MPEEKLRILVIGAHPDDCEWLAGGTAALYTRLGHRVKFVSLTNGDAGHHEMAGAPLARRRKAEAAAAAKAVGAESLVLDHHDGTLLPTLELRNEVTQIIREYKPDLVMSHRPNDYHPDHRYTGVLVQDAAYMVVVPHLVPEVPALRKNPVFLYYEDNFQRPNPFRPDIAVALDDVIDKKIDALDSHVSQFYEWLPWVAGTLAEVPKDLAERKAWLKRARTRPPSPAVRTSLVKWYGADKGNAARYYEAFEICEYGTQPNEASLRHLFPMLH